MGVVARALNVVYGLGRRLVRSRRARAEREEALGRLAEATALYVEAGEHEQAARLFALRAGSALDPAERLRLLALGIAYMPDGEQRKALELRRCRLALDLAKSGGARFVRSELEELGQTLESLGEASLAAEAFSLAGDADAEARALVAAGAVDRLEAVLEEQQRRERAERNRDEVERKMRDLDLTGRRREALELGRTRAADDRVAALLRGISARRLDGPSATLVVDGVELELVFGDEILIGRADADVVIPSPAVSREHLRVRRTPSGAEIVDLGSRNGTTIAGARLDAPLRIAGRVELVLGAEVKIAFCAWGRGGVRIEIGGRVVRAPLGAFELGRWRIAPAADRFIELDAGDGAVWLGGLRAEQRVQLCRGDVLSESLNGVVRLEVPQ